MNKDDLQFQIDQLKKDRMVSALESGAVSAACLLFTFALSSFGYLIHPTLSNPWIPGIVMGFGFIFAVAFGVTNFRRQQHIKYLEKKLYTKK